MRTLTEKYNAVLDGKLSKKQFVRDARLALPNHITQYNGFDDTVAILKNKGMVFESLEKYKEEKISDHEYTANSQDMFSIEAVERGVDYELEKKGFNTIHRDFTEKDYEKAKEKVITNLEKNPQYYLNILADEPTRVQKKRKDVMKPVEKNNHVDKDNGMVKANLKESVNEAVITYGIEYKSSKNDRKFKKASLTKTTHNPNIDKMMIKAISKDAKSLAKQDGWVDYRITKDGVPVNESQYGMFDNITVSRNDSNLDVYKEFLRNYAQNYKGVSNDKVGKMSLADLEQKFGSEVIEKYNLKGRRFDIRVRELINKGLIKVEESINEGRRPKSKGGKVVKEDDYGNGGYVELMSADLDRGIKLIQKAWDDWKAGPMTEPGMIEHAKEDLIKHIHDSLTFFDEQDSIEEEEIQALQEKKTQLKESFKKLIVKVLTEDKKKVNEDIKGVVDLSSYESQVADVIEKVDPTVQKVDVKLSHQEDAELAQAEIVVTPGSMDAEELRDKTIGNPKRFFTGGLRSYFINTLKNVSIDIRDGILYISFDFYVNPFAGEQGKQTSPSFAAKMKRGDYGRLDEKETEQKAFTLDGKVL